VILGFGLGYAACACAERFPGRPLIIVEKRIEFFRAALEHRDLGRFLAAPGLVFVLGGEPAGLSGVLALFGGKPEILSNRALRSLDAPWYDKVEEILRFSVSKNEVNQATLRRFGKRWVRNLGANMAAIRDLPGIRALTDCLGGEFPVLLAAAGPSLDEIGPYLGEIRERCLVVAVDTSLRYFLKAGLEPDFCLVVDPQYWNSRHLDRLNPQQTCLVAESAVYPPVLRLPFPRRFLCSSLFPLGRYIEDRLDPKGSVGAGGSVATTAWDFARLLKPEAIWIAGLDLAYPGFKTHFRGALFEERFHAESNRLNPGETWSVRALRDGYPFWADSLEGGKVLTDQRLSIYSSWFENRFYQHPEPPNMSLSPRGLGIPGLKAAKIEALLALPLRRRAIDERLEGVFSRIAEAFRSPEEVAARAARYTEARSRLLAGLESIATLAGNAGALAASALAATALEENTRSDAAWAAKSKPRVSASREAKTARVLAQLDEANRRITESEVKGVAGFLFPQTAELEANLKYEAGLLRHLEFSLRFYRALEETVRYNLKILKSSPARTDTQNNGRGTPSS
jgi:hypothetical protein